MIEREGFDLSAAAAMWRAHETDQPFSRLRDRAKAAISFWALYDGPKAVGGAFFESDPRLDAPVMHAATSRRGRGGFALRRIAEWGVQRWGCVYAPVSVRNRAVCRLLEGSGFHVAAEANGARIYRRTKWAV